MNIISRLPADQIKKFKAIIRSRGYTAKDFELSEIPPGATEINATRFIIIVNRKKTSVQRHYDGGHGTNWLSEFERDLRGNVFGFVE